MTNYYRKCLLLSGKFINRNADFAYGLYETIQQIGLELQFAGFVANCLEDGIAVNN